MTKKPVKLLFLLLFLVGLMYQSCEHEPDSLDTSQQPELPYNPTINLRWIQNYDTETKQDFEKALLWGFSFLGAEASKGSMERALVWHDNVNFTIDFDKLGFSNTALEAINKIVYHLKETTEYQVMSGIDAGRLIVQLFNNTNHYYEITGVSKTYQEFRRHYQWDTKKAAIIESAVAFDHRRISVSPFSNGKLAFTSEEGTGSLILSSFNVIEFEVVELMKNGQFRYAIYDLQGDLKVGADATKTIAGKPAKCAWCHEINIQPPFAAKTSVDDYYSVSQFDSIVQANYQLVQEYRNGLHSDLDFSEKQAHTLLEKMYISFMEPSANRLQAEWNLSYNTVITTVDQLPTHEHEEFTELGDLYDRNQIDVEAPYFGLPAPYSARETSDFEPNYLY